MRGEHGWGACVLAAAALVAAAVARGEPPRVLAAWHSPDDRGASQPVNDSTPDESLAGIAATLGFLRGGFEVRGSFNSIDGTYGVLPGAEPGINAVHLRTADDQKRRLDVSITNNTGGDLVLEGLHFDYGRGYPAGPKSLTAFVLTDNGNLDLDGYPSVFSDSDTPVLTFGDGDFADAEADLTVLADHTLAPGETAALRIEASDADGIYTGLYVDNVAITGRLSFATDPVVVDLDDVLSPLDGKHAGLNTIYISDDDGRRAPGSVPLGEAFLAMGATSLRYPGGEVSDNFVWSKDLTGATPPTFLEVAGNTWITDTPGLWDDSASQFTDLALDFDEFMSVAATAGAHTVVCLPFDRMFLTGGTTVSTPYKNFLIDNAVAMITYARDNGYDVDVWQIGNESYLNKNRQSERDQDGPATPQVYGQFVLEFAEAIEAAMGDDYAGVNIGINGDSRNWFRDALSYPGLARHIDVITPHTYQWGVIDFEDYVVNRTDLVSKARDARNGLAAASIPQADKDRISIGFTEYGAFRLEGFDEATDPTYDQADMARAIMLFEVGASLLREPDVLFTQHWATRWIGNEGDPIIRATDSLTNTNGLTPNGEVLAMLFDRIEGAFVGVASSADRVNAYAIHDADRQRLSLYLVNRASESRGVDIALMGAGWDFVPDTIRTYRSDDGTPYDRTPTMELSEAGATRAGDGRFLLPAYSINLVTLSLCRSADIAAPLGVLNAADVVAFMGELETGGFASWAPPSEVSDVFDALAFLAAFDLSCGAVGSQ